MGKVRSYHGYESMSQVFPGLSKATLSALRAQLIRDAIASLKPGSYRKNRLRLSEDIAGRGNRVAFSYRDDGSYTIFD